MTLRLRLTLVSIGATLAVALVLITTWQLSQRAAQSRYVEASIAGKRVLWNKVVQSYFEQLSPDMKVVTRDRVLLKALRSGDLASLKEAARTTHNTLSSIGAVDRLQIMDLEGHYLASVPDGFTGRTGKKLVLASVSEKAVKQGIEFDDDGRLMAVLSFPVFARGKIKGVAVYAKNLQEILDDFQRSDQSLARINDLNGRQILTGDGNGAKLTSGFVLPVEQAGLEILTEDDRYHVVASLPIKNQQGEIIAALITSQDHTDTYATQANLELGSYIAVLLILLGSSVGTYWYGKRAFRPLNEVVEAMNNISDGDLTTCSALNYSRQDEIGQLTKGMCNMVEHLRSLISEILDATGQLTVSAQNLHGSSEAASSQNRQQLLKTKEVCLSLSEMAATIRDIAKNTESAASAAREADEHVNLGQGLVGQVGGSIDELKLQMDQAAEAVHQLEANGRDIEGILDVIRGIADQTGLLALNASIEAARAGEHGRGFAVVADEVRSLSNRTQQSTGEIHALIESLKVGTDKVVQLMRSGNEKTSSTVIQVREAEAAFVEIKNATDEIRDLNTQIASAVEEQSVVAAEVNANVTDMEKGSEVADQQTIKTAEAGKGLGVLSEKLSGRVGHFHL
jgi:methyl-accepting chemotaxis protein